MEKHLIGSVILAVILTGACVDDGTPALDEPVPSDEHAAAARIAAEAIDGVGDEAFAPDEPAADEVVAAGPLCPEFVFQTAPPTKLVSCMSALEPRIAMTAQGGALGWHFDAAALALVDVTTGVASWPGIWALGRDHLAIGRSLPFTPIAGHCYVASAALRMRGGAWTYPLLSGQRCF